MAKIINFSPNFSKKPRKKTDIKFVILHYTGMQSEIESIKRLVNPKSKVSCHYFINKKGKITRMVNENRVAWHAGKSKWKKFKNLNHNSIGIELENRGHHFGYENFSNLQIKSLINICKYLKRKYKIKGENFLGHSDIAPNRKLDPGEKFPWKKLSKFNLGVWYNEHLINSEQSKQIKNFSSKQFFQNLHKIGYRYFSISKRRSEDKFVIKAFQRKYLPTLVSGKIDKKTAKICHFLANNFKLT